MTHPPCSDIRSSTSSAGFSWPWPIEMLTKLPRAADTSNESASSSTHGVGSTPGKSTKNTGVDALVSM
eukprot:CAMPEP_0182543020 /NCGR_PEP_ID=MMETSP1323-20130603/31023_1 /TAXON_ID=236787 /ORGANISM="Florenciella parvula, Strain RCC1693" /LENGTH=67 /DNA_ID=CAMNT_0024753919 /DNA_START=82 /DNA_END=285 /DNA_ORIENTATION=-